MPRRDRSCKPTPSRRCSNHVSLAVRRDRCVTSAPPGVREPETGGGRPRTEFTITTRPQRPVEEADPIEHLTSYEQIGRCPETEHLDVLSLIDVMAGVEISPIGSAPVESRGRTRPATNSAD